MVRWTSFAVTLPLVMFAVATKANPPDTDVEQRDCAGSSFAEVGRVAALPTEVRRLILRDGAVADRGQPYQDDDVVLVPRLPNRRLEIALVSDRRVAAAIERGGPLAQIWLFERSDAGWIGKPAGFGPEAWDGLLHVICPGYRPPEPSPDRAVSSIVTSKGDIVLTLRSAESSVAYELIRRRGSRGTSAHDEIRFLGTNRRLSPEQRSNLHGKLAKILAGLPENDASHSAVAEYLKALEGPAAHR